MNNSGETSKYIPDSELEPKRFLQCESGLHVEEIPEGSIFELAWEMQQQKGQSGNLIIPEASCTHCSPENHKS